MAALAELSKGISGSRADRIAIVGGTLIDGTGAAPVADATVLIEKGRIVAAGPKAAVKIPHGAQKIDARGKTILPGLWDMHAHFEQVEWGPIYLATGATTVRDPRRNLRESWTVPGPCNWASRAWTRPNRPNTGWTNITTRIFSR